MLRVVVGDVRVLGHVHPGPAPHAAHQRPVVRLGEAVEDDRRPGLAVVHPVEAGVELLVVHAVAAQRHLGRLRLGVLAEVALHPLLEELQDRGRRRRGRAASSSSGGSRARRPARRRRTTGARTAGSRGHRNSARRTRHTPAACASSSCRSSKAHEGAADRRVDLDQRFPGRRSHRPRAWLGEPGSSRGDRTSSSAISGKCDTSGPCIPCDWSPIEPVNRKHLERVARPRRRCSTRTHACSEGTTPARSGDRHARFRGRRIGRADSGRRHSLPATHSAVRSRSSRSPRRVESPTGPDPG